MIKKTIIQLWGKQGSGKTGTIKIINQELIIKYNNASHIYALPLPGGEISESLICNGYKVGLESMGDDLWAYGLDKHLDEHIITNNCDVLICASRIYNNVNAYLEDMANQYNYRIIKLTNYRSTDPTFSQDILNQYSARDIVSLIDKILTGVL